MDTHITEKTTDKLKDLLNISSCEEIEEKLKSWELEECYALMKNDDYVTIVAKNLDCHKMDCFMAISAAIEDKEFPPEPGDLDPDEYAKRELAYLKTSNIVLDDTVRLNKGYLEFHKGLKGRVIEDPSLPRNENKIHYFRIAFPIVDSLTGNLCWIAEEEVPLSYLELVEKSNVRYERIKKELTPSMSPESLAMLEEMDSHLASYYEELEEGSGPLVPREKDPVYSSLTNQYEKKEKWVPRSSDHLSGDELLRLASGLEGSKA